MWYPCTYPPDFAAFETQGLIARSASSATWFNRVYPQQNPFPLKDAANEDDDDEEGENGQKLVPVVHGFLPLSAPPLDYNNGCPPLPMNIQRSTSSCGFYPGNPSFLSMNGIQQSSKLGAQYPFEKSDKDLVFQSSELKVQEIPDGKTKGMTGSLEAPEALEAPKKAKDYSDSSLTPDSTLPPVIRRRNRNRRKKLATSLVEATPGTAGWEQEANKMTPRMRSQSISDDQWAQVMASQAAPFTSAHTHHTHTSSDMSGFATTRRGFNNSSGRLGGNLGRGMVSSASVCDLNALSQQQQHPHFNNSGVNSANSFQQLNLMNYGGGMMWPPCELCQGAPMYPGHHGGGNMKRTASNLSMNVSSMGSDLTGYPWPPHVHHHMPMYPGYYPGYHPHMVPMSMQGSSVGLNMSIPDSMHTFGKVPSSPAPSLRSSSHRSNKSSKSRSFSTADLSRRTRSRNKRRSDSEESQSSSGSENDEEDDGGKPGGYPRGNLPWQCEHCTFINSASARSCGMCSKSMGGTNGGEKSRWSRRGSEKRRSERRKDRRTDHEDDVQDISDYDNDGGVVKSNLSFNIKDSRKDSRSKITSSSKSSSKNKKKSRRRSSSASPSGSGSGHEDDDIHRVEKHMRDLRISSRSRTGDYDGVPRDRDRNRDKDRNRDRSARKKEGRNRFKNRGHHPQERSRTPARQTPQRSSPVEGSSSPSPEQNTQPKEKSGSDSSKQEDQNPENPEDSGEEQTMVDKVPSDNTVKQDEPVILQSSRRKSPVVSLRPATPEQIVEDVPPVHEEEPKDEEEEEEVPVEIRVEEAFDVPQYIQRRSASPKLLSRSPSPSKGDENSLANTLDEIETMGTNEVADFEITAPFDEIPIVDPRQHILNDTPVMAYIPQPSPEPAAFEAFVPEPEVKEDLAPAEIGDRDFWFEITKDKPRSHSSDVINDEREEHQTESSEKDEESVVHEVPREPRYEPIEDAGYLQKEQPIDVPATWSNEVEANEGADDGTLRINYIEEAPKEETLGEVIEPREVARSTSSGSSAGRGSGRHERQCTPLSYSSSDAQFYSPPDSPDLSLSDKLTDQGIICKVKFGAKIVSRSCKYRLTKLLHKTEFGKSNR